MQWAIDLKIRLCALLIFTTPLLSAADVANGCGETGYRSETYTMEHDGLTRFFREHVPSVYD